MTTSFLLVSLIFQRRLYWWIYHTLQKIKNSRRFMKKFDIFTDNKFDIHIKWITKKVKQLFKLKSRNPHPSYVIYEGVCSCLESYIGETVRNVEIRRQEHDNTERFRTCKVSDSFNPTHSFTWKVLPPARSIKRIRQTWKHQ